jgi:transposase InsO family protein
MEEKEEVKRIEHRPPRGSGAKTQRRFTVDEKLKAIRLHLEEGFSLALVGQELNVSKSSLGLWLEAYRLGGEAGLQPGKPGPRKPRLPAPITDKIIEIKQQNPAFGIKRISQLLRRWFFLPASPETVRQRLHEAELMAEGSPRRRRNLTRPRFFERATPNQMWQSDIFTFRLGGRYAYLIAFMDDYSRFIVGADLFRSPTANAVIEVYRIAVGEYQPPKEMLTDNGRQYTSWRGTSRFEAELKKDRVAHFKSRPHHPMTLGKIERFWSTIWQEFLVRAQFDSFDSARERIKLWIKYHNHKRPHQGIEGLCPADRFFEIQSQLRQTIEAGIQENLLELALRGKPQSPFYMVGRMDGQSVVLRAEKGKLKLSISDQQNKEQELVYDLNKNNDDQRKDRTQETNPNATSQCPGQSSGSAGGVDGAMQAGGCVPATEHQLDHLQPLATPGDGGNASSTGEPGEPDQRRSFESTAASVASKPMPECHGSQTDQSFGTDQQAGQSVRDGGINECQSQRAGAGDLPGPLRPDERHRSGPDIGHQPPTILPMGTTGAPGIAHSTGEPAPGASQRENGPAPAIIATPGQPTGETGAGL